MLRRLNPVKLSRTVDPLAGFAGGFEEAEVKGLAAEGALVELVPEDLLVGLLKVGEGEQFRQEVAGQGRIGGFVAQALDRSVDDPVVIKGQLGQVVRRQKKQSVRLLGGNGLEGQQGIVTDAGRPATRVSGGAGKGIELFQVGRNQAELFPQHPTGCRLAVDVLVGMHVTTGQGRLAEIRLLVPFLKDYLEKILCEGEKHHVHSENDWLFHARFVYMDNLTLKKPTWLFINNHINTIQYNYTQKNLVAK